MNRSYFPLVIILLLLQSCGEKEVISKQEFRSKISKSLVAVKDFSFLDEKTIVYTDTAFHLPAPVYKARVVNGEPAGDTMFFYYYHTKDLVAIMNRRFGSVTFTNNAHSFDCGNILTDSATGNFVTYFRKCDIYPNPDTILNKSASLDSALCAAFGYATPTVTLEEVKQEEEKEEPPPPPPPIPPKPKNKKAAQ